MTMGKAKRNQDDAVPTRVVGYIRVSTDKQDISPEAQRAKIEAYCKALDNVTLVSIEVDDGFSGKNMDREGLKRALGMLDDNSADAILVSKLDRLTRKVVDLGMLVDKYFADGKKSLLSVSDQIDTRTASGRFVLVMMGGIAQWERETIGERTSEALRHLQSSGVKLGASAMGWTRTLESDGVGRKNIETVEEEEATIKRMMALRESGLSYNKIARMLDVEGRRTKKNKQWHATTVQRILDRAERNDERT